MSRKSMLKNEMPTAAVVHRMDFSRSSTLTPNTCHANAPHTSAMATL